MSLAPTLSIADAARTDWPVVVVGAGPAGSFAAHRLARSGVSVLLVEARSFPRPKVCGGCLNARTLAFLAEAGLGALPASLGAVPIDRFELHTAGRMVRLTMPTGMAVSRAVLDAGLVEAAIAAGASFLPETRAVLGPQDSDTSTIRLPGSNHEIRARRIVVADGLGGSFLPAPSGLRSRAAAGSRIGAGAVLDDTREAYEPGVLHMVVGKVGYVGVTRVENGQLDIAAALDRAAIDGNGGKGGKGGNEGHGGLAASIGSLLDLAGMPPLDLDSADWRGTAALSRRAPRVAFQGVFLVGDAAGYVEPFTGEGISWALETGREIAGVLAGQAESGSRQALERTWRRRYRRRIVRRQHWCRGVSWSLRQPALVSSAAWLLDRTPALARPLMAHLNQAPDGRTP